MRAAKRPGRARRALLAALMLACIAGAALLARMGALELGERRRGDDFYAHMAERVERTAGASARADSGAQPAGARPETDGARQPAAEPTAAPGASPASAALSDEGGAPGSEIDFEEIWQTCPDVVGWIRLEDSVIDYPIVRGEDNEFYLHHLADGTPNETGSIMMDQANSGLFDDAVNILHGHHMRNGSMFGGVVEYSSEEYYRAHRLIRLYTPAGDWDVEVFAAYSVNGYEFGYPTSFEDEAQFNSFIRRAVSSTPYETGVDVSFGDRLLMLSTCTYGYDGERYIVLGRITEPAAALTLDKGA